MGTRQDIKAVLASGLFDLQWYRQRHPGVPAAPSAAAGHFLEHVLDPGHDPGPGFSVRRYLDANPAVAAASMNPLLHYLLLGREEGRQLIPVVAGRLVPEHDFPRSEERPGGKASVHTSSTPSSPSPYNQNLTTSIPYTYPL